MSFLLETNTYDPSRIPLEQTLFHTANGYLGVRGNFEEGDPTGLKSIRGTYINGFHDTHPIHHPEKLHGFPEIGERMLNVTDAQSIRVAINGEAVEPNAERISAYYRCLDMRKGYVTRRYEWSGVSGGRIRIESRRMASLSRPEIFIISYRIQALNALTVSLTSELNGDVENYSNPNDPRVSGEGFQSLDVQRVLAEDSFLRIDSRTRKTGFDLSVRADHRLSMGSETLPPDHAERTEASAALSWTRALDAGETMILEKRVRYADSMHHPNPAGDGFADRDESVWFETLATEQKTLLDAFWRESDIAIVGDDHVLAGLRFSLYNLLQSAPVDAVTGIPAKGLSGEGYEGHYFWDTETYMVPFFLYTRPQAARRLLEYRHATLPGARNHARSLGHEKGAAYPWRTITGRECSAYYPSGSAQYHINADIALAVRRYWEATQDDSFLMEKGAEILFETARIWMEVGNFASGAFHIHGVTGPDEYTCMVSDNYYTNRMARENLRTAAAVYEQMSQRHPDRLVELSDQIGLGSAEPVSWTEAAEAMFLPYDEQRDLTPQDSTFLDKPIWDFEKTSAFREPLLLGYHHMTLSRHQVCKQADVVLAYVLLGSDGSERTVRNSFEYYEQVTTHDSSLSYAAFAIMAARLGDGEKALAYFRETASLDLDDSHGNTTDGIHAANLGGAWMAFVQGFGGFDASRGLPTFSPVLPRAWKSLEYRIQWRGSTIAVQADHERLSLSLEAGDPLTVEAFGTPFQLEGTLEIPIGSPQS